MAPIFPSRFYRAKTKSVLPSFDGAGCGSASKALPWQRIANLLELPRKTYMVGDKIGADQNPSLTDIFQKIAVVCFPSCRGSLSTLIHTADRLSSCRSGMTIGRHGSRVQSLFEFENRRHFVQARDERTAECEKRKWLVSVHLWVIRLSIIYRYTMIKFTRNGNEPSQAGVEHHPPVRNR